MKITITIKSDTRHYALSLLWWVWGRLAGAHTGDRPWKREYNHRCEGDVKVTVEK